LDNGGWVYFNQLRTDVAPDQASLGEKSWEQQAAAGTGSKKASRGHYRGGCYSYYAPGYYWYPGYHHWGWGY